MKLFDAFTFFNEFELLEIRLEFLSPFVDKFVICESTYTHSGKPKPLNFLNSIDRFRKWESKIEYLVYEPDMTGLDLDKKIDQYDPSAPQWKLETSQRNFLMSYLQKQADEDIAFVTDLDEIWNPKLASIIASNRTGHDIARIAMAHFTYYFNCRKIGKGGNNFVWQHPFFAKISLLKANPDISHLRVYGNLPTVHTVDYEWCGWHFTYMGGANRVLEKIKAYAHQESNNPQMTDMDYLNSCISKGINPFVQDNEWSELVYVPTDYFPESLANLLMEYPDWLRLRLG